MSRKPDERSRFPAKCAICRERQVDFITEPYEVTVEHDGRSYHLTIPDLTLLKCGACANRILPMEACDRVSDSLRITAGFMQPSEIKQERSRLRLTQAQMAELLNVGEATLCRWETGAQIQSHHMDVMLRAFFDVPLSEIILRRGCSRKRD